MSTELKTKTSSADVLKIVGDAQDYYIAGDGLMRLYRPAEKYPERNDNDNGILFLVYYYYLLDRVGALVLSNDGANFYNTYRTLERVPGLSMRNPGRLDDPSSHDNTTAAACGAALFGFNDIARDIVHYGLKTGHSHDARRPNQVNFRYWRWGGDVAVYKFAAGYFPAPYELIWMYGALIWGSFFDKDYDTTGHLLNWLRLRAMDKVLERTERPSVRAALSLYSLLGALFRWRLRRKHKAGMAKIFDMYFSDAGHPNKLLARGLFF